MKYTRRVNGTNAPSYLGLLRRCNGYGLRQRLTKELFVLNSKHYARNYYSSKILTEKR